MALKQILTIVVLFSLSTCSYAYEFEPMAYMALDGYGSAYPGGMYVPGAYQATTTVKPEECRFYLTYLDEGSKHTSLLDGAKEVKEAILKAFQDINQGQIQIEALNYALEKSLGGIFQRDKNEIFCTIRYGELVLNQPTLQGVEVTLPYQVEFELKAK